ncbi:hypothetical protein PR048_025069 [Dryococelus australis]|uniref:Uncharacterized protein n=1 Tax=Dryococelus australis TaxID=614101 RepID=A0ABQ9GQB6_9NEOP|nr:hypothetical protein PR048_025069 [Dryococelus australis]
MQERCHTIVSRIAAFDNRTAYYRNMLRTVVVTTMSVRFTACTFQVLATAEETKKVFPIQDGALDHGEAEGIVRSSASEQGPDRLIWHTWRLVFVNRRTLRALSVSTQHNFARSSGTDADQQHVKAVHVLICHTTVNAYATRKLESWCLLVIIGFQQSHLLDVLSSQSCYSSRARSEVATSVVINDVDVGLNTKCHKLLRKAYPFCEGPRLPKRTIRFPGGVASGFSHVGIVSDDATGSLFFSRISRFSCPRHSGTTLYSPRFALIGSQDLDAKSRPSVFTNSLISDRIRFIHMGDFSPHSFS